MQLVTGLGADQLFLEAGDELAGADFQRHVLRRAALEGGAVDRADEVDGHAVARARRRRPSSSKFLDCEAMRFSVSSIWSSVTSARHGG